MQQPKLKVTEPSEDEEPQELARFRREWLAELLQRKTRTGVSTTSQDPVISGPVTPSQAGAVSPSRDPWPTSVGSQNYQGPSSQTIASHPSSFSNVSISSSSIEHRTTPLPRHVSSALNVYRKAVEHEQRGELDEALLLYRQAFRMDEHVDTVYHREEKVASILSENEAKAHRSSGDILDSSSTVDELLVIKPKREITLNSAGPNAPAPVITGIMADLISDFPEILSFEPEDEQESVPLRKLPDELLVMILRKLDPTSIERFATANRKARIVALEPSIWKDLVSMTYKPPQVLDVESMGVVVESYLSDFRRVFIEHPRVRMDGVYIATCHYVRHGLHDNSWVNINHLITYHRYLRFYPNGQVLSLLANEEHTPQQIIPLLKPTLRMKGLCIGTWHLSGSTIHLSNLNDASSHLSLPISWDLPFFPPEHPPSSHQGPTNASGISERKRYTFLMSLNLRSRPLGRWNKLTMETYASVNLETGDTNPVVLKHERPFWFSKVRSYAT